MAQRTGTALPLLVALLSLLRVDSIYFHVSQGAQRACPQPHGWRREASLRLPCAPPRLFPPPRSLSPLTCPAAGCFIEEMPGQTLLLATYSNPDFKPWGTPGFAEVGVFIDVLDPAGQPAIPRRVADTSGKVAFHSTAGGEYKLCFSTNGTRWGTGGAQKFVRAPPPCAPLRQCPAAPFALVAAHPLPPPLPPPTPNPRSAWT